MKRPERARRRPPAGPLPADRTRSRHRDTAAALISRAGPVAATCYTWEEASIVQLGERNLPLRLRNGSRRPWTGTEWSVRRGRPWPDTVPAKPYSAARTSCDGPVAPTKSRVGGEGRSLPRQGHLGGSAALQVQGGDVRPRTETGSARGSTPLRACPPCMAAVSAVTQAATRNSWAGDRASTPRRFTRAAPAGTVGAAARRPGNGRNGCRGHRFPGPGWPRSGGAGAAARGTDGG